MGLDVPLVHGGRGDFLLHHHICPLEGGRPGRPHELEGLATLEWMSVFWPANGGQVVVQEGAPSRMASRTSETGVRTS